MWRLTVGTNSSLRLLVFLVPGLIAASIGCKQPALKKPTGTTPVTLRWNERFPPQAEVVGLSDEILEAISTAFFTSKYNQNQWNRVLALYVVQENIASPTDSQPKEGQTPVAGAHVVIAGIFGFSPQFPLRPGLKYRIEFDPNALASILAFDARMRNQLPPKKMELTLSLPAPPASPRTAVAAIYPSSDVLPENQLKFYIHFSAPMSRGEAYDRVRLEKSSGELVPIPFLELSEELWDADAQRFTLIFEPGRVKRGLMLREEIGPALVAGEEYVLVVDGAWRDANGQPLGKDFRKTFRATPQDETQPDPRRWKLNLPSANSNQPLVIEFDEPLDHAMLHRVIRVVDANRSEKTGEVTVDRNESRWSFTPDVAWEAGAHELVVEGVLEDLAGNSVGRKFEVSMEDKDREVPQEVRVPFSVAPPR
jgi:hypothetical protein